MKLNWTTMSGVTFVVIALGLIKEETVHRQTVRPLHTAKGLSKSEIVARPALVANKIAETEIPEHLFGFDQLVGDASNGESLFFNKLDCSSCHAVVGDEDFGGPSLADASARLSYQQLITSVLQPSREFAFGYQSVTVVDLDGVVHRGIVDSQSNATTLVLTSKDETISIPRDDIDEIVSGLSPMPEGLADELTPQEFSDLLAYLSNLR